MNRCIDDMKTQILKKKNTISIFVTQNNFTTDEAQCHYLLVFFTCGRWLSGRTNSFPRNTGDLIKGF